MFESYGLTAEFTEGVLLVSLLKASVLLLLGWFFAKLIVHVISGLLTDRLDVQAQQLIGKLLFWLVFGLFVVSALKELGFDLGVLMGAAGILTVAIGFASQTSAANVISGLFVMGEGSIKVGDVIRISDQTGEVLSIDWLSVKLRTFDNLFVRIPNEQIIKSEVVNLSKFPIRRVDIQIGIAYGEDIREARTLLLRVADANPLCLESPEPLTILKGFGESSIDIQFSIWALRANFLALRNSILEEIKQSFDEAGIEIPFPHRTLYIGDHTRSLPLSLNSAEDKSD